MTYIGNEPFLVGGKGIDLTMNDFWRWSYSDLNNNALLSMLAKFIVASSLEITSNGTTCCLISKDGYKIEVKSAAYIQTLDAECPDHVSFSIAPIKQSGRMADEELDFIQQSSDVSIFCIYKAQTSDETPLDLDLWDFYVLQTKTLRNKKPALKTITLPSLMQMEPVWCDYYGIGDAIQKVMTV